MNFIKHLHTVNKHRFLVFIYCARCGLFINGLNHDLSKYSYLEFSRSVKYFDGHFSPIMKEREDNSLYSEISVHHTNRNKHHFEYWIDIYKGDLLLKKIEFKYNLEYCIDMISASKTYLKKDFKKEAPLNFFLERKVNYLMHPANKEFVIYILTLYKDFGFKKIKKRLVKNEYKKIMDKYKDVILIKTNINENDYM